MKWYGKELTVTRGESFSLTCKISTKEGVPYMISSAMTNPTFLLTISDTLYKADKTRYILNCWTPLVTRNTFPIIDVTELPAEPLENTLYNLTQAYSSGGIVYQQRVYSYDSDLQAWKPYDSFVNGLVFDNLEPIEIDTFTSDLVDRSKRYLYHLVTQYSSYKPGYYYYNVYKADFVEYVCVFMQSFMNDITKNWVHKNYYYELHLLSGEFTEDFKKVLHNNTFNNFNDNPFSTIFNDFVIIPKTQLNVLSKL